MFALGILFSMTLLLLAIFGVDETPQFLQKKAKKDRKRWRRSGPLGTL